MSAYQTAAVVACRVLGLLAAIHWLGLAFSLAFEAVRMRAGGAYIAGAVAARIGSIAIPFTLWVLAPWVARQMVSGAERDQTPLSPVTIENAQAVAISLLGIFFIVEALSKIVVMGVEFLNAARTGLDAALQSFAAAYATPDTLVRLTEIVLGVWLFVGARRFVRLFQRFNSPSTE